MRQDQWLVTASVELTPGRSINLGRWDGFSGGDVTSTETKHKPGGMGIEVSLGGPRSVGNVTINRLYDLDRDHDLARALSERVGRARMAVNKQPLDIDGFPQGKPQTYHGILMTVNYPDHDANGTSSSKLELVCSTNGDLG